VALFFLYPGANGADVSLSLANSAIRRQSAFETALDNGAPTIRIEICNGAANYIPGFRRASVQTRVGSMLVKVMLEIDKFLLQVGCRPEECLIQELSSDRTDQSLTNGCDSGTCGTVLISVISNTRRFACH
jgi:hypothetical protein